MAMVKVLEALDCWVHYNTEQTCCGMAAYNAGYWEDAKEVGEKFIREFQKDRPAVGLGGACTGMVRNDYSELFYNSVVHNQCKSLQKNLKEFTEFIVEKRDLSRLFMKFNGKVAYMDACQALRECKIKEAPRTILEKIQGMTLVELPEQEQCCGFGGIFSVKDENESVALGNRKLQYALEAGADYIVSTDSACLMHLDAIIRNQGLKIQVLHIAELMAKSMQ